MDTKTTILKKLGIIYWLMVLASIISFFTIIYYMFIVKEKILEKSHTLDTEEFENIRGNVLDINGYVLSTTTTFYEIRIDPKTDYLTDKVFNENIDSLCYFLAKFNSEKTESEYKEFITNARETKNRNLLLFKSVDFLQLQQLKKFPIFKKGKIKGGLIYISKIKRVPLNKDLARRTIGIENSTKEYFGIERKMNIYLSGTNGIYLIQKLSTKYKKQLKTLKESEPGVDVVTTLDINMVDIVYEALRKRLEYLQAQSGVAILMEVSTGEIRAVVNLTRNDKDSTYSEKENLAVTSIYEPGSVMKLASFMLAFEKNSTLSLDKIINTGNGLWQVTPRDVIKDYNYSADGTGGFGKISVQNVFEVSSNVGTAKIINEVFGNDYNDFTRRLASLGFDKPMNLGLESEPNPIFHTPSDKDWSGISMLQISVGYEISITPMHLITFYNAIANNGKMLKPIYVRSIQNNGQIIKEFKPEILNPSICSEQTLLKLKTLLKSVITTGTGENVNSDLIQIAGKSGTSQVYQKSGYNQGTVYYNTTFIGYFPADNPKYTCLVWIHKPSEHYFSGSGAAGPVLKEIAEKIYTFDYDLHNQKFIINDLPKKEQLPSVTKSFSGFAITALNSLGYTFENANSQWVSVKNNGTDFILQPMHIERKVMPDVRGMNARDAVFLLENFQLKISISGSGKVIKQSVAPGTNISKNQNVILQLN